MTDHYRYVTSTVHIFQVSVKIKDEVHLQNMKIIVNCFFHINIYLVNMIYSFHPITAADYTTLLLVITHRIEAVTLEHVTIGASWVRGMRA